VVRLSAIAAVQEITQGGAELVLECVGSESAMPSKVRFSVFKSRRKATSSLPTQKCACEDWEKGKGKRVRDLNPFPRQVSLANY
jgi:hypothetical protein